MNTIFKAATIALTALSLYSCKGQLIGSCDTDVVTTPELLEAGAEGGTYTVNMSERGWWISIISLDTVSYDIEDNRHWEVGTEYVQDQFRIVRTEDRQVEIELKENTTGIPRKLTFGIQSGNCFDGVTISQQGE